MHNTGHLSISESWFQSCEKGYLPIVQYLVEKGANIEAKDKDQQTLILFTSRSDVIKYLVSKGANKNAKDKHGQTPYDFAPNFEIRELLKWRKTFQREELNDVGEVHEKRQ